MKKLAISSLLILTGILLTGYAVLVPMLQLIGTRTTGVVTDVRRQGGEPNEMTRNLYNYGAGFYFVLADGRKFESSCTVVGTSFNSGIPRGPTPVLYLKIFPQFNVLEKTTTFSVGNLILFGTGLFLISLPLKKGRKRKRDR